MIINQKNIFVIDAVGALLSAISLGIVLPVFHQWIGMPIATLYFLAALPIFFGFYDIICLYFVNYERTLWLRIILGLNSAYCILTLSLMCIHYEQLQPLGLAYFISELVVLIVLIRVQYRLIS